MADQRALGKLGWAFSAVAGAVLLVAALVVTNYPDHLASAGASPFGAAATPSSVAR